MNIVVWICQGLLAFALAAAGAMKLVKSREDLLADPRMAWVDDYSAGFIKLIAAAELAGGIGLVLPWLTGIVPILTPIAAVGLIIIMLGAASTHIRRSEIPSAVPTMALALLAAFVAYARFSGEV